MIKTRFGDRDMSLGDLKSYFYNYGIDRIGEFYSQGGLAWFYPRLETDIKAFRELQGNLSESQNQTEQEQEWVSNFGNFVDHLEGLGKYKGDGGSNVDMHYILKFTDELEMLVQDFAEHHKILTPKQFLEKTSKQHYVQSSRGVSYPRFMIKD